MIWGPSCRFGTGREFTRRYGKGRGTFGKVQNVSGDTRGVGDELGDTGGDPGRVEGPARRSGTGWGTHGEVWDWSGEPGEVRDGSRDAGEVQYGLGTHGEVQDGS